MRRRAAIDRAARFAFGRRPQRLGRSEETAEESMRDAVRVLDAGAEARVSLIPGPRPMALLDAAASGWSSSVITDRRSAVDRAARFALGRCQERPRWAADETEEKIDA